MLHAHNIKHYFRFMTTLSETEIALATHLKPCDLILQVLVILGLTLKRVLNYSRLADSILEKYFIQAEHGV